MKKNNLTQALISGIQQIGIGNTDVYKTWDWYRKNLGMDLPVFDEAAEAALMLPYTEGEPRSRHAILALNMMGGGGAEIWQYTSRVGQKATFDIQLGDLGIFVAKFKSKDLRVSHEKLSATTTVSDIRKNPAGEPHFYAHDLDGNVIELTEADDWFNDKISHCGGVTGAVIGVTDMDTSIAFYNKVLGYDIVVYDETNQFDDLDFMNAGSRKFRRVLLQHSEDRRGAFSQLFGKSEIELVQDLDRQPQKMFKDRMWGDLGYIHLCFDISGMDLLREKCKQQNCAFTVDSGDFDMGEAAGQFAYIEDPDGTLIEFVEAHKVPILKKIGWYLNLKNRNQAKPLPRWMVKSMGLNRVKN